MKTNYNYRKQILILTLLFLSNLSFGQCWTSISAGTFHSVGLKSDGTIWGWGYNLDGQLGQGNFNNNYPIPTQIGNNNNWVKIFANGKSTMAIKSDGTLWAWGLNSSGQLGDGTTIKKNIPTQIGIDNNWSDIALGFAHTLAIKNNGTLWSWGTNVEGQLGTGIPSSLIPQQVGTDTDWSKISSGSSHNLLIKTNGSLWGFGRNNSGQLGIGSSSNSSTPIQIGTDTNWTSISCGLDHSIGIKNNNTLFSWGANSLGQLGDGTYSNKSVPTQIGSQNDWEIPVGGGYHTLVKKLNGTIWSCGSNDSGQLGDGTTVVKRNILSQINAQNDWNKIYSGFTHSFALKVDGQLWDWGYNGSGQLGNNSFVTSNVPIAINCPTPFSVISIVGQLIGTPWSTDIDLTTTNGINYQLLNQSLPTGEIKFRQDHAWIINWGGTTTTGTFPTSTGVQDGLNIMAIAGTYDITFNKTTGVYSFNSTLSTSENQFLKNNIVCYPNPTNDIINISSQDEVITQINVYDMFGRLLKYQKGNANSEKISIQELPNAMYLVEVRTVQGTKTMKTIKE